MAQWYQSIFNSFFLSAASRSQLRIFEPSTLYGLGILDQVSPRLGDVYYHDGAVGGFLSETYFDKDSKASIFVAINTNDDYTNTSQFTAPVLDVFTKEMPKKANDASITALVSPAGVTCNTSVVPVVTLKNNGSANLTSATIQVKVDGAVASPYTWTGTLLPGTTTPVTLSATPLTNGMHDIKIYPSQPNGAADGYSWNDTFSIRLGANLATVYNGYFSEGFEGPSTPALVWNTRNGTSGQAGVSHLAGYNSIHSMARSNVQLSGDYRSVSNIDMPAVNIAAGAASVLRFRYAYNPWAGAYTDSLEALISMDCGSTWTSLFHNGGLDLSEGDSTESGFFPQTASEWKISTIPLGAYSGNALSDFGSIMAIAISSIWMT